MSRTGAIGAVVVAAVVNWVPAAHAQHKCAPALARLVSIEGSVAVFGADGKPVDGVAPNAELCARYVVEVGERSRAALLLLSNETTLRLDQKSSLTLRGVEAADKDASWAMRLNRGALHVITRTKPRSFTIETPFINASVEGTEFTVTVAADDAAIALQEGRVCASNAYGSARIDSVSGTVVSYEDRSCSSGEKQAVRAMAVSAVARRPPIARGDIVVEPANHVKWALYYPAVFDTASVQADLATLTRADMTPERVSDPQLLTRYAGALLSVGRIDDAEPYIARALRLDPSNSGAHALLAVVAVVRNDKDRALDEATKATQADPSSPAAWVALSYAQQASFKVEDAVRTMEEARSKVSPSALFLARLAELYMSVGDLDKARATAEEARAMNPAVAKIQTVSGFAYLISIDTAKAKQAFDEAIRLDQADPLPRLGLGLAKIREGDLAGGREQLEIAAVLDPANSLIRSYLGKAYYEEKRDDLAATQFALAKERDPRDPTPWFYDAILKETQNRPVEAFQELQQSVEKNASRGVYRSKLLLDQDIAARTVDAARVYQDLGFTQLALSEGYNALAADPGESAAHLFLADAYANLPRHDIARVSEALQARLRQPVSLPAMDLQINTDNLLILRGTGPSRPGTNEFNALFNRNQAAFLLDGIVGNRQTGGDQFIASGVHDNVSFAASQLHYETQGFGDNNSARKDIYDLFAQGDLSSRAGVQAEIKRTEFKAGENFFPFDPDVFYAATISERSDTARIGGRFDADVGSQTIWNAMYEDRKRTVETVPDGFLVNSDDAKSYTVELQHLRRLAEFNWIVGGAYIRTDDEFVDSIGETSSILSKGGNVYLYGQWIPTAYPFRVDGGLAAEFVEIDYSAFTQNISRHRLSPKLGITWTPLPGTTVRAAALSTVRRPLIASQTLEPTHVAGCNQFFSGFDNFYGDIVATISRRACLGIDQKLSPTAFVGADVSKRKLWVPSVISNTDYEWRESTAHLYAYKALERGSMPLFPNAQAGLFVEYDHEKIERPQALTGPEGIEQVTTDLVPIGTKVYLSETMSAGIAATYVRQRGTFSVDVGLNEFEKNDHAWITDVAFDYRLPRRMGFVTVGARNLFDKSMQVFELDPFNPQVPTKRFVFAKVRLLF